MFKRAIAIFAVFTVLMGVAVYRIVSLSSSEYASVGNNSSSRTVIIGSSRGKIYDCSMKLLVDRNRKIIAAVKPTVTALSALRDILDKEEFSAVEQTILKGYPASVSIGDEPDCADILCFDVPVRYSENDCAQHIVGYLGGDGSGVSGIERSFESFLSENGGQLFVTFDVDAIGRVLAGTKPAVKNKNYDSDAGVVLTIDSEIQRITEEALDRMSIDSGAAVVLEASTGAIRAMVSRPSFDRNDIAASLDAKNSPLLNKALCSYSVGSIFKPFIAAAAMESRTSDFPVLECTGSLDVDGTAFTCPAHGGHGTVDLAAALQKSCNIYFIQLAQQLNREFLISMLSNFGFGRSLSIAAGIACDEGVLPDSDEIALSGELANLAFGQGKLSASPLQIAAAYLSLVCGGTYKYPYLVEGTVDENLNVSESAHRADSHVISEQTSNRIRELLTEVVSRGSGKSAYPLFTTSGGKTATAQSGIFDGSREIYRTWFAGFFPADEPQYIVVIMKEDGSSGAADCAPTFRIIADGIVNR